MWIEARIAPIRSSPNAVSWVGGSFWSIVNQAIINVKIGTRLHSMFILVTSSSLTDLR